MEQEKQTALLDNIRIVLVNTTHPGNIGAVARAMKNMGLRRLTLVNPKQFPDPVADERAAHATDILAQAKVVATLDEALADVGLVLGTSARVRSVPWPLISPREAAEQAVQEAANTQVALLFGREAHGLTNEELQKCHLHLTIPTDEEYTSLNLAMALQVVAYELRVAAVGAKAAVAADEPLATAEAVELLYQHLEKVLVDVGYLDPKLPRQTMPRFRRLFNRARLTELELSMLRGALKSIGKKLPPSE